MLTYKKGYSVMKTRSIGYWGRLCAALLGRDVQPTEASSPPVEACVPVVEAGRPAVEPGPADEQAAQWRAHTASLEMDLAERDKRIDEMRSEYATLQTAKERTSVGAGQDQLERLFKKLAGPLANLSVLTAMAETGREVEVGDLAQLIKGLEKELARAGLEPMGKVGEKTVFDVTCHQRMSGGAVREGVHVTVQIPGYRMGEKILIKTMVSAGEDHPAQEPDNGQDCD
jgi:molecular chaperone GrpE (heat shock protein)